MKNAVLTLPGSGSVSAPVRSTSRFASASRTLLPYLLIAPAMVVLFVFLLYPIGYMVYLSFFDWNMIKPMEFVGLENFKEMLGDQTLYKVQTAYGQVQVKSFAHQLIPYGPVTVTAEATSLYFFDKQENRVEAEARSVSTL